MGAMSMSTKIRKDEFIQSSETGVGKLRPADLILYFTVSTFGQKMYFASEYGPRTKIIAYPWSKNYILKAAFAHTFNSCVYRIVLRFLTLVSRLLDKPR